MRLGFVRRIWQPGWMLGQILHPLPTANVPNLERDVRYSRQHLMSPKFRDLSMISRELSLQSIGLSDPLPGTCNFFFKHIREL